MAFRKLRTGAISSAALLLLGFAPAATARSVYVTAEESKALFVLDTSTDQLAGGPIPLGDPSGPYTIAISPDGRTAYAVNAESKTVTAVDTATNQVVGTPMPVGKEAIGIAITPDGSRAYVSNRGEGTVSVLDLQTRQSLTPIPAGEGPNSVAVSPDGKRLYVADIKSGDVRVFDTATNQMVGGPIPVPEAYGMAITPDGRWLYVASRADLVAVIDTATNQVVGSPIPLEQAETVDITPDGSRAYVPEYNKGKIAVIDTASRQIVGSVPTGGEPEYGAITPDGKKLFVSNYSQGTVVAVNTISNTIIGSPIPVGKGLAGLAVVPDQSPTASILLKGRARPGVPYTLNGGNSSDPDGKVAAYSWEFSDETSTAPVSGPIVQHTYRKPGMYGATLTVGDNEGCSVAEVFTGQTAYCHGSPAATEMVLVKVAYPGVKLRCRSSAKPGGCRFKVRAVTRRGKRLKAQSALARGRAKPGKSATISLRPKKAFAKKLAETKKVLAQVTVSFGGRTQTKVRKLKIVR
jgi:YVTN family beta-propeller protein